MSESRRHKALDLREFLWHNVIIIVVDVVERNRPRVLSEVEEMLDSFRLLGNVLAKANDRPATLVRVESDRRSVKASTFLESPGQAVFGIGRKADDSVRCKGEVRFDIFDGHEFEVGLAQGSHATHHSVQVCLISDANNILKSVTLKDSLGLSVSIFDETKLIVGNTVISCLQVRLLDAF